MPTPEPWLQYGALGLLTLVLCGLGVFVVLVTRSTFSLVNRHLGRIAGAMQGCQLAIAELSTYIKTRLEPQYREKLDTLRGIGEPEPRMFPEDSEPPPPRPRPPLRRAIEIGPKQDWGKR